MKIWIPFTRSSDETVEFGKRAWRWAVGLERHRDHPCVLELGIWKYMAEFRSERDPDPRPVRGLSLQLRPFEWRVRSEHIYYDGPHCFYQLGPLALVVELDCKRCSGES